MLSGRERQQSPEQVIEMALLERMRHPRGRPSDSVAQVCVRVRGGFRPNVIYATAGRPIRIVFHREETAACSASVVFPALGKCATLPPYEDVAVDLLPDGPGEYAFTCQAGILVGHLIVLGTGPSLDESSSRRGD